MNDKTTPKAVIKIASGRRKNKIIGKKSANKTHPFDLVLVFNFLSMKSKKKIYTILVQECFT